MGEITPFIRVITPVTLFYGHSYKGYCTPTTIITGFWAHLVALSKKTQKSSVAHGVQRSFPSRSTRKTVVSCESCEVPFKINVHIFGY